jgi:phosphate starvation-inducible PhoH-like protein
LSPVVQAGDKFVEEVRQGASGQETLTLAFDENRLLSELFGEHDEHLALIEERLGIEVTPRGNRVALQGPASAIDTGRKVLLALFDKLRRGARIDLGEVEGQIRLSRAQTAALEHQPGDVSIRTKRKVIHPRSPTQRAYMAAIRANELVFGVGPAGTGKTYLAVAAAAASLAAGEVDRIILSRPAVEAGERLGFLPGDMKEKVDPYLRPLYDALYDMLPANLVARGLTDGTIEIAPLAFMRGRTLQNAFIILDEAQNTTPQQMKMFLTRLGERSRMVVTGDPSQVDLPRGVRSGLVDALKLLDGIEGISQVRFSRDDVVRHALVARIIDAYDRDSRSHHRPEDED